jgi:hypothetical protein
MESILELNKVWSTIKQFIQVVDYAYATHPSSPFLSSKAVGNFGASIPEDIQTISHDIMVRATKAGSMNTTQFCAYVSYMLLTEKCPFLKESELVPVLLTNYTNNLPSEFSSASFKYSDCNFEKYLAEHVYPNLFIAKFAPQYADALAIFDKGKAFDVDAAYLE